VRATIFSICVCCSLPSKGRWLNTGQDWKACGVGRGMPEINCIVKFSSESTKLVCAERVHTGAHRLISSNAVHLLDASCKCLNHNHQVSLHCHQLLNNVKMVKGQRTASSTKGSASNNLTTKKKTTSTTSSATPTRNDKSGDIPSCAGCGTVIGKEVKALQCDNCSSLQSWKCSECLDLNLGVYDA